MAATKEDIEHVKSDIVSIQDQLVEISTSLKRLKFDLPQTTEKLKDEIMDIHTTSTSATAQTISDLKATVTKIEKDMGEGLEQQKGRNKTAINDLNDVIGKLKVDFENYKKAQETTETQATSGSASEGAGEPQTEHQGQEVKELQERLGDVQAELLKIHSEYDFRVLQAEQAAIEYQTTAEECNNMTEYLEWKQWEQEKSLTRTREELEAENKNI